MTKFVSVGDAGDIEKIYNYMFEKGEENINYFIAPKLMYNILMNRNIRSAVGVSLLDIPDYYSKKRFDVMVLGMYIKSVQSIVFRIDTIKSGLSLIRPNFGPGNSSVIFGLDEDSKEYEDYDFETIETI